MISVAVDRLTKSAYFLPVKVSITLEKFTELHIREIVRRHGIPVTVMSNWDAFVAMFWKTLHIALKTMPNISTTHHPQTDKQSERVIQTLEDMLRACALDMKDS